MPPAPRSRASKSPWASLPLVALCGVFVAVAALAAPLLPSAPASPAEPLGQPSASESSQVAPAPEAVDDQELISSYQAISQSSNENRVENIRLASEAIDGVVIEPGETFSFNDAVGDTEHDERYLMAPIISDDQMVDGRGGGICQVSTALYIAALKANLDIVERYAHTLASDYAPVGLDATLAYGQLDLRIRNTSEAPITIRANAFGQTVEVALYGEPLPKGVTIDATSKIVDRFIVGEGEAQDGQGLSAGTYYVAEGYRVYYENGTKTGSELLSSNTYKVGEHEPVSLGEGSVDPTK